MKPSELSGFHARSSQAPSRTNESFASCLSVENGLGSLTQAPFVIP